MPHTAAALQQLFDFVTLRCQQTAARLSSSSSSSSNSTTHSKQQDQGPQDSVWGGVSQASAQGHGQGEGQGPVEVVPVLLAHNGAMFDLPVIRVECGRHGVEFPQDWWWVAEMLEHCWGDAGHAMRGWHVAQVSIPKGLVGNDGAGLLGLSSTS